jgi:hypothetical protein
MLICIHHFKLCNTLKPKYKLLREGHPKVRHTHLWHKLLMQHDANYFAHKVGGSLQHHSVCAGPLVKARYRAQTLKTRHPIQTRNLRIAKHLVEVQGSWEHHFQKSKSSQFVAVSRRK